MLTDYYLGYMAYSISSFMCMSMGTFSDEFQRGYYDARLDSNN